MTRKEQAAKDFLEENYALADNATEFATEIYLAGYQAGQEWRRSTVLRLLAELRRARLIMAAPQYIEDVDKQLKALERKLLEDEDD
jgi:hypothetical protein